MFRPNNPLHVLSARVRRGDAGAAGQLRGELEPPLRHMVRHALRTGDVRTVVARRSHGEAARLRADDPHLRRDENALVERIAEHLCDEVIARLRNGARPRNLLDTLACARDESVLVRSGVD